jgi:hypothetical protein
MTSPLITGAVATCAVQSWNAACFRPGPLAVANFRLVIPRQWCVKGEVESTTCLGGGLAVGAGYVRERQKDDAGGFVTTAFCHDHEDYIYRSHVRSGGEASNSLEMPPGHHQSAPRPELALTPPTPGSLQPRWQRLSWGTIGGLIYEDVIWCGNAENDGFPILASAHLGHAPAATTERTVRPVGRSCALRN